MLATIGHNRPPGQIELARDAMGDLNRFLTDNPVIQSAEQAHAGGAFVERTRKCLQDLDDERTKQTRPLNDELTEINGRYKSIRDPMERVLKELRARLTSFAVAEEQKRQAIADEARKQAELAEMQARLAEQQEQDAKANAAQGECVNVGASIANADAAFSDFKKADRAASRAERDVAVRLPSQLGGRALGVRSVETLHVDDHTKAIQAIGLTDKIEEAILSAARAYRKLHNRLPDGISSTTERSL